MSPTSYKRKEMEGFDVLFPRAKTPAKTDSTSGSIIGRCREESGGRTENYCARSNSWTHGGSNSIPADFLGLYGYTFDMGCPTAGMSHNRITAGTSHSKLIPFHVQNRAWDIPLAHLEVIHEAVNQGSHAMVQRVHLGGVFSPSKPQYEYAGLRSNSEIRIHQPMLKYCNTDMPAGAQILQYKPALAAQIAKYGFAAPHLDTKYGFAGPG
ncbi:hypothetical protein DFH09DRAFT_1085526 [Mycena vulgaris]|nr:hypothetical protein DFH09DRAFT_1085526 [Mycena vulgaris]